MNLNIYFKEMKRNRKSALSWSIILSVVILFFMSFYPIIMDSKILENNLSLFDNVYFKGMMDVFGMSLENLTHIFGFYVSYSGLYIILLACIYSIMTSSGILAKEENEKTAEFLLTRPVSRAEVITSKFAAYLSYLILLNSCIAITALITFEVYNTSDYSLSSFLILSFYYFLLTLAFGSIGLFLSIIIKRGRAINGITIGLVVGTYFLNAFSRLGDSTKFMGYFSPFHYIDTNVMSAGYSLDFNKVLFFLIIISIMISLTYLLYRRKDILV